MKFKNTQFRKRVDTLPIISRAKTEKNKNLKKLPIPLKPSNNSRTPSISRRKFGFLDSLMSAISRSLFGR